MANKHRAAVVGTGRMAGSIDDEVRDYPGITFPYSHAGTYQACDKVELVAASDIIPDKLEAYTKRWNIPHSYADYRAMIDTEKPEIISVTTRPAAHRDIVVYAAEHGVKGIWCEKPLCCSMKEADEILDACERNGVKLNLGVNRRYGATYRKVRQLIEDGAIGELQSVIAFTESSALWSHTHTSDLLLLLAGDPEVEFVQATTSADEAEYKNNALGTDPTVRSAYFRFKNGVNGYILATIGYDWEITGTTGKIRTFNDGLDVELRQQQGQWKQLERVDIEKLPQESSALRCLEDLIEALETGRETRGNIHLGRRSQEMMMGVVYSHGQGGARVPLPLQNREFYVGRENW